MNKVTIVGAGRVGESTAQFIAERDMYREIVLPDINKSFAKSAALDMNDEETAMFNESAGIVREQIDIDLLKQLKISEANDR